MHSPEQDIVVLRNTPSCSALRHPTERYVIVLSKLSSWTVRYRPDEHVPFSSALGRPAGYFVMFVKTQSPWSTLQHPGQNYAAYHLFIDMRLFYMDY